MFRDGLILKSLCSRVVIVGPCMVVDDHGQASRDGHHSCRCCVAASDAALLLCSLSQQSQRSVV